MSRLRSDEGGWALVTAMLFMTFMLGAGLSVVQYMDRLTQESSIQRTRETAFNAAESALTSQVTALTRAWPSSGAWPVCDPTTVDALARCPAPDQMRALHATADTTSGFTWTTAVRDDTGAGGGRACSGTYYDDAAMRAQPTYDANRNGCLWIRAQATTRERTRTLVALVRSQPGDPSFPIEYAVYAGRLDFDSSAVKTFVTGGKIASRCIPQMGETVSCAGYPLGTNRARTLADLQTSFAAGVRSRDASWGVDRETMSELDKARWKAFAQATGGYYNGTCPPSMAGAVVWVDGNVSCAYTGTTVYNSQQSPGLFVMNGGTLTIGGTVEYWGVVYFPNPTNRSDEVFKFDGTPTLHGGLIADGNALVNIGTSGLDNIDYQASVLEEVRLPGTAGVVQNTWRELAPSTVVP